MFDLSRSSFCSRLRDSSIGAACTTADEIALAKLAAMHEDPYALELAKRLAMAQISLVSSQSFAGCYTRCAAKVTAPGDFWLVLTIVCLEDKTFGDGLPGSIVCHPVLEEWPALRDIAKARTNPFIVELARRFQAAFATMGSFGATKPQSGVTSFTRLLQRVGEPEDLWVVIAGLSRTLQPVARGANADDEAMTISTT